MGIEEREETDVSFFLIYVKRWICNVVLPTLF